MQGKENACMQHSWRLPACPACCSTTGCSGRGQHIHAHCLRVAVQHANRQLIASTPQITLAMTYLLADLYAVESRAPPSHTLTQTHTCTTSITPQITLAMTWLLADLYQVAGRRHPRCASCKSLACNSNSKTAHTCMCAHMHACTAAAPTAAATPGAPASNSPKRACGQLHQGAGTAALSASAMRQSPVQAAALLSIAPPAPEYRMLAGTWMRCCTLWAPATRPRSPPASW